MTVSSIDPKTFDQVKQVRMDDASGGGATDEDFTADIALNTIVTLDGSVSMNGSNNTVTGFGTNFQSSLKQGDFVTVVGAAAAGADLTGRVLAIASDSSLTLDTGDGSTALNSATAVTTVPIKRIRGTFQDTNRNILLRKLRKNNIKTLKTDANSNASVTALTVHIHII